MTRARADDRTASSETPYASADKSPTTARGSRPFRRPLRTCVVDRRCWCRSDRTRVDVQVDDLGEIGPLEEHLLPWTEMRDQRRLGLVQMEQVAGPLEVHPGIRQEELRRAALDDRAQQVGSAKSSLLCVARSIAAFRFRQVLSASVMYALRWGHARSATPRPARRASASRPRRGPESSRSPGAGRRTAAAPAPAGTARAPRSRSTAAAETSACPRRCRTAPHTARPAPSGAGAARAPRGSRFASVNSRRCGGSSA